MTYQDTLKALEHQNILALDSKDLAMLLESTATVREVDTCLSGWIRILESEGTVLVQEETTEGEILVRKVPSIGHADRLVEYRLEAYERMWDGCGCKIDYHA